MADITAISKVIISAEDRTGPAFNSTKAGLDGVNKAVSTVRGALGNLAGILSVGMFAGAIKSAIDAADAFNDLSKKVGLPVETIAGLSYAAKQSGVDLETLSKGVVKLGINMTEAAAGNKEMAAAFTALGVSVRDASGNVKKGDQALFDLADKFAKLEDGPEKAALAVKIFGKAGADMIPFLNEGGAKLRELKDEYDKYSGVSTAAAAAADAFNDTLAKLQLMFGALFREIAAAILPTLQALADQFLKTKGTGEGFKVMAEGVAVAVKLLGVSAIGVIEAFKALGTSIGVVFAAFAQALTGDFKGAWATLKLGFTDVTSSIKEAIGRAKDVWSADTAVIAKTAETNLRDRPRAAIAATAKEADKLADQFRALVSALEGKDLGIDSSFASKFALLTKAYNGEIQGVTLSLERYRELTLKLLNDQPWAKKEADALKALEEANKKNAETLAASVEALEQQARAEEMRVRTFGMAESAITAVTIAQEQYNLATLQSTDADAAAIEATKARIAALERLQSAQVQTEILEANRDAIEAQRRQYEDLFRSIDDLSTQLWAAVTQGGGDAAKKITDVFKNTLLALLYKLTVQPFVINITAALTGAGGSGGLPGLTAGGGGLTDILGRIFGGVGNTSPFGPINPTFGTSFAGGITSPLSTLMSIFQGGTEGFGGLLNTLGAGLGAITPVLGLIAPLIAGLFKPGGGPKGGGFSSMGDVSGITGTDSSGRWFTPNTNDSTVRTIVEATSASYTALIRQLGGTAGNVGFALGFDTDPKGTAPNRLHSGAFLNGRPVYEAALGDLGRDDAVLQAALETESKRALLAALQASELPEYLANILNEVDVATADSAAIDNVIAMATALQQAVEVVGSLGEQFEALQPEQIQGLVDAFGGLEEFVAGFAFLDANFTTDADRLARATTQLQSSFADLGVDVPQTHQAFLDLLNGLDLTTAEGQALYASLVQLAPAYTAVNGTAQQAAEAEQALADARREAIASAEELFLTEFYTEQEQAARRAGEAMRTVTEAQRALGVEIPTSVAGFRALIEGLDRSTQGGQDLYDALILLAPAILDIEEATGRVVDAARELLTITDVGGIFTASQTLFDQIMAKLKGLVDSSSGDFGSKISLMLSLIPEQIAKAQAQMAYLESIGQGGTSEWQKWADVVAKLGTQMQYNAALLARYTVLTAQFDAERAAQLVELEQWYHQQAALLAGDPLALQALYDIFKDKWDAIVAGVGEGVEGTISQLEKLRENLKDYLKSLALGPLSPLSPMAKLEEAKKQYEAQLLLAQGGDLTALANISKYSDAYLQIAREVFGSSSGYNAIFDQIVTALTALTIPPATGGPEPLAPIIGALPTGGAHLVSQADLQQATNVLADLLERLIASNQVAEQTEAIAEGLQQIKRVSTKVRK